MTFSRTKGVRIDKVLEGQKIIASLRRIEDLNEILNHKTIETVFVLKCSILDLINVSKRVREHKKNILVHIDLVEGLGKDSAGVKFLSQYVGVDGIITTKTNLIKAGQQEGLLTVQRFFMVDSEAVKTGTKMAKISKPDALEILPAFLPKYYLDQIISELRIPVITGGLIRTKEEALEILTKGFRAISTSRRTLWNL